jgi:hypothetical protein
MEALLHGAQHREAGASPIRAVRGRIRGKPTTIANSERIEQTEILINVSTTPIAVMTNQYQSATAIRVFAQPR